MSKLSFFFTTLIAAVPAAFLGYLCVAAFLFHSDTLPPVLMGVAGLTLLLCVAVVAMPVYVLLKSSGRAEPTDEKQDEAEPSAESEERAVAEDEVASEEEAVTEDEEDVFMEEDDEPFDESSK